MVRLKYTDAELEAARAIDPEVDAWLADREDETKWYNFEPRPDDLAQFDEQHSFVNNADKVAFMVGGNASGTTVCAAAKTAKFLLHRQPPPRKDTPFWIISQNYEMAVDVCWSEKLLGNGFIPECEIQWDRVSWMSQKSGRPKAVPLKPWPAHKGGDPRKNWMIEFKSYEQQRAAMQGRSIGGFWFSEQFPLEIFLEVLRGCREYMYPGGQFAEFTPIEPELSIWVEKAMEDPPTDWKFYRCNTELNIPNLEAGWYEAFFAMVPEELIETRKTGALASFEGVIYQSFNRAVHVMPAGKILIPPGVTHAMGTDWGASEKHPQVTVWGCYDGIGNWIIYDEYWSIDQTKITADHAAAVVQKCEAWGWPMAEFEYRDKMQLGIKARNRDVLYHCNYADPGRPGEINEFTARGVPTAMARNKVYEGINEVRRCLKCHPATGEPGLIISDKCVHLIEEMRKYRWDRRSSRVSREGIAPAVAKPEPLKRFDDTVDALRYLIFSEALPSNETIHALDKKEKPIDRKSIQLVRNRLDRAMSRAASGMMPTRSKTNHG
jgi:hypothetical protein